MTMGTPLVSVIMSVHNEERFVGAAVESVLGQTLSDFELIVVDDASTDRTPQILAGYQDPRIRVFRNPTNVGLAASLNHAIEQSRAPYLARMDADDLCEPERLATQVAVLNDRPEVAVLATWYTVIGEQDEEIAEIRLPSGSQALANALRRRNVICHGSVMMRKEVVQAVGGYREEFRYAQDYELWLRMLRAGLVLDSVPRSLYRYRLRRNAMSKVGMQKQYAAAARAGLGGADVRDARTGKAWGGGLPQEALYLYAVGIYKLRAGQRRAARHAFVESLRLYPHNLKALAWLGLSFLPPVLACIAEEAASWLAAKREAAPK